MKKYVIVAGNIGVGKSTLVQMISSRLGWRPLFEPVGENPYLSDFYHDMQRWAFHSQIFFLTKRLRSHPNILDHPTSILQDRSVYEDAEVFAQNLYHQNLISERDFETYRELYQAVVDFLPPPDLIVYLRPSTATLSRRIAQRGRAYEQEITPQYIEQLNKLYENWIKNFTICPVLTVPADDLDYVAHPYHLDLIVNKIIEKLTGQEEVVFSEEEVNGFGD